MKVKHRHNYYEGAKITVKFNLKVPSYLIMKVKTTVRIIVKVLKSPSHLIVNVLEKEGGRRCTL